MAATLEGPPSLRIIEVAGSMAKRCSDSRYFVKGLCCEIANRQPERYSLQARMLSSWVKQAIKFAGTSQAVVGRKLTTALGREIDRAAVNKLTKGSRALAADEMLEISRITGFPVPNTHKDLDLVKLWESFTEEALSVVYADDPHAAQDILGVIRATIALHSGEARGLANPATIRAVVHSAVERLLAQRKQEIPEETRLSHHPELANYDQIKLPKR
jgi:hypothetical protein